MSSHPDLQQLLRLRFLRSMFRTTPAGSCAMKCSIPVSVKNASQVGRASMAASQPAPIPGKPQPDVALLAGHGPIPQVNTSTVSGVP